MAANRDLNRLVQTAREDLNCEIKSWLNPADKEDRATLVKAILALANSGGGYILVGFSEAADGWNSTQGNLESQYTQDAINSIVSKYCDPSFQVACEFVKHDGTGVRHPVITVPGGHSVPVRCKKGSPEPKVTLRPSAYYIRRPGPASEEPQTALEWSALIRRCVLADRENLLQQLLGIFQPQPSSGVQGPSPHQEWVDASIERYLILQRDTFADPEQNPLRLGHWRAAFSLAPEIKPMPLADFRRRLRNCVGDETGWPVGWMPTKEKIAPYTHANHVEVWLGDHERDAAHTDFWRASPMGRFIICRGYVEDTDHYRGASPGKGLDFTLPVWRIGEFLLYAARFVKEFSPDGSGLHVTAAWTGLDGRRLSTHDPFMYSAPDEAVCHEPEVSARVEIDDGLALPELLGQIVRQLTEPLYSAFGFYEMPAALLESELNKMRFRRQ